METVRPFWPRPIAVALLAGAASLAVSTPAAAQITDTDQAEAMVVVVEPLSFFRVQDLNFGEMYSGPTAGVVRVTPDGARTATGGVTLIGTSHQPARFAGMGVYNQLVRIRMGAASIPITGPGTPMTVSQFEIGSTPNTVILSTAWTTFGLGSPTGMFNFPLGGTLNVNANQAPGSYSGTFSITLEYM